MRPISRVTPAVDLAIAPVSIAVWPDALDLLDGPELARLARLRQPADRSRFVAGRLLLRRVVADRCGIDEREIRFAPDGRGRLRAVTSADAPDAPDVSLAHAGSLVVAAAGVRRVGVDLEPVRGSREVEEIGLVGLTPAERLGFARLPAAERAIRSVEAWTIKEAYAKLLGHGLCLDFTRLSLAAIAGRSRLALRSIAIDVDGEAYRCSLAAWDAALEDARIAVVGADLAIAPALGLPGMAAGVAA